ncbi:uncharacterized protein LOC143297110 [Babylonia areolata]|uniref:uncharacterized protein LOC143297110 n=1 Tax=Babylonia areolata TaxID=304850 RepID=UPI003FD68AEE
MTALQSEVWWLRPSLICWRQVVPDVVPVQLPQAFTASGKTLSRDNVTWYSKPTVVVKSTTIPEVVYPATAVLLAPGLLGNVLLVFMSLGDELKMFSYSVYLVCASITDSVSLTFIYVDMILQVQGSGLNAILNNLASCLVTNLVFQIAVSMSPWIMVGFSLDRWVAIVYPLKRKTFCTVRNARIACSLVLVFCLACELPAAFDIAMLNVGREWLCGMEDSDILVWMSVETVLNNILPCFFLLCFNTHSLITIKQKMNERSSTQLWSFRVTVVESGQYLFLITSWTGQDCGK